MRCIEPGVLPDSEYFYHTPTLVAQPMLYYIVACGHFYCDENYCVERENFGNHLLVYVISGSLNIVCKEGESIARAGQIALFDCNKYHKYFADQKTEFLFVHFEGANSITICDYISKNFGIVFNIPAESKIPSYIATMTAESRINKVVTEIEHSRMIYTILCSMIQEVYEESSMDKGAEIIKMAVKMIRDHVSDPLTVQEVARHVNLSLFYFTRLFKKHTGFTPHEFIVHNRIDNAKYLLRTSSQSVKEIAFAVGYQSEHSFSVSFSNKVGISPIRFRNLKI